MTGGQHPFCHHVPIVRTIVQGSSRQEEHTYPWTPTTPNSAYMAEDAEAPLLLTHQGLRRRLPATNLATQVSQSTRNAEYNCGQCT